MNSLSSQTSSGRKNKGNKCETSVPQKPFEDSGTNKQKISNHCETLFGKLLVGRYQKQLT